MGTDVQSVGRLTTLVLVMFVLGLLAVSVTGAYIFYFTDVSETVVGVIAGAVVAGVFMNLGGAVYVAVSWPKFREKAAA